MINKKEKKEFRWLEPSHLHCSLTRYANEMTPTLICIAFSDFQTNLNGWDLEYWKYSNWLECGYLSLTRSAASLEMRAAPVQTGFHSIWIEFESYESISNFD